MSTRWGQSAKRESRNVLKGRTLVVTFSRESGVSIAKAIRMTWDLEYDMGRRRYVWRKQG